MAVLPHALDEGRRANTHSLKSRHFRDDGSYAPLLVLLTSSMQSPTSYRIAIMANLDAAMANAAPKAGSTSSSGNTATPGSAGLDALPEEVQLGIFR